MINLFVVCVFQLQKDGPKVASGQEPGQKGGGGAQI